MSPGLIASVLLLFQAPSTPVTYRAPAKLVPALLQDISAQTHVSLKADPAASKEVVLVSVKDLPLSTLMDKLAEATSCEWVREDDDYILKPDNNVRRHERDADIRARAKEIETLIQSKDIQDALNGDPTPSDIGHLNVPSMAALLDAQQLAALEPGQCIVWASNDVTQTELPLSGDAERIVTSWIAWRNANPEAPFSSKFTSVLMPNTGERMLGSPFVKKGQRIGKLLLSAAVDGDYDLTVSVQMLDQKGVIITQVDLYYGPSLSMSPVQRPMPQTWGHRLRLSPIETELMGGSAGNSLWPQLSTSAKKQLRHPESFDPLALVASEGLLEYADRSQRQLIADLPDTLFQMSRIPYTALWETVEEVKTNFEAGELVSTTDDGKRLTIRSLHPSFDRAKRIDRRSLAGLLADAERHGYLTLDALSEFAAKNPWQGNAGILRWYVKEAGGMAGNLDSWLDHDMWSWLRFFASLDPGQRASLRSGGQLPISTLNEEQRRALEAVVFGPPDPAEDLEQFQSSDIRERFEVTEALPNGLPMQAVLSCKPRSSLGFITEDPRDGLLLDFRSVDELASSGKGGGLEGVIGSFELLPIRFTIEPGVDCEIKLVDWSVPKDQKPIPYSQVPADFLAQVESARQSRQSSGGQEAGGTP